MPGLPIAADALCLHRHMNGDTLRAGGPQGFPGVTRGTRMGRVALPAALQHGPPLTHCQGVVGVHHGCLDQLVRVETRGVVRAAEALELRRVRARGAAPGEGQLGTAAGVESCGDGCQGRSQQPEAPRSHARRVQCRATGACARGLGAGGHGMRHGPGGRGLHRTQCSPCMRPMHGPRPRCCGAAPAPAAAPPHSQASGTMHCDPPSRC